MGPGPAGRTPPDNDLLPMMESLADAQSFGSLANLRSATEAVRPGEWRDALHGRGESGMRCAVNIFDVRVQDRVRGRGGDVPLDRSTVEVGLIKDYIQSDIIRESPCGIRLRSDRSAT
jgi:hypothetical protein